MYRDLPIVRILLNQGEGGDVLSEIGSGDYRCIFKLGSEAFSVRRLVPLERKDSCEDGTHFKVEFLTPEEAMERFHPGATFAVWSRRVIGTGIVVEGEMQSCQGGNV